MRTSTTVAASERANEVERFDNLAPTTTSGDYIKHDGTDNIRTTGVVTGPGSSTDNAIARFDGATGAIIQNSALTLNDSGQIEFVDDATEGLYWYNGASPEASIAYDGTTDTFYIVAGTASTSGVTITCGSSGTVLIGPPSAAGLVAVDVGLALKAGTSSGRIAKVGGTIYASTTTGNNGTTVETDLWSQSVAANVLATNHDCLRFLYSGSTAANGNTKRIRVYWGVSATPIFDTTAQAVNAQDWTIEGVIIRTGAATQKVSVWLKNAAGTLWTFVNYATAAETLANALTLKITGQSGTASNDITFEMGKIMWEPAP